MAFRSVRRIGDPVLRQVAQRIPPEKIGSEEFRALVDDMVDAMHEEGGIGIAAPQVGESVRLCIVELTVDNDRYDDDQSFELTVMVNPQVSVLDEEEQAFWEGCLSVPELRGLVHRPRKVRVDYLDESGTPCTIQGEDFFATVLQHELDHLDGVLFVDKIRDTRMMATVEEFEKHWIRDDGDQNPVV